jgi:hypothetical protein
MSVLLRWVVFVHRWLGVAGGLLFLSWFVSGIVMIYARMPELPVGELIHRAQPLALGTVQHSPADAIKAAGRVERMRIAMLHDRPVYRLVTDRTSTVVFADTGELLTPLDADRAVDVVRELAPEHAATIRYDARLSDADQWTMGVRALMPMHRVAVGDGADTYFYVTERSGEVVMRTTARERRWAYPGAILHWLYFAPFRRQAALWTQSIIWLSIAGCVMCVTGLVWGLSVVKRSPYTGLMKWHHYSGLIFGAVSFTWVLSGLLSMGPWGWSPGNAPTREQRERVAGGPLELETLTRERFHAAATALARAVGDAQLKEIDIQQFQRELYLIGGSRMISVEQPQRGAVERLPNGVVEHAARDAMPGVPIEDAAWLNEYDNYYYAQGAQLPLPVLRVRYGDANGTWLYLDPQRGAILRKSERRSRLERWLYHGLHSLDFPFLYHRRPLWDVVMIVLSLGGVVLSATTVLPAWRRLRRHARAIRARLT